MAQRSLVRGRALTAVLMLFTFFVAVMSGVVSYISPRGRTAHVLDWHFLALDKAEWLNLHTAFSLLFLIAALFHIGLNWRPLLTYVRQRVNVRSAIALPARARLEMVLAAMLSLLLLIATLQQWPPVSYLFQWRMDIRESWESRDGNAPENPNVAGPMRGGGRHGRWQTESSPQP